MLELIEKGLCRVCFTSNVKIYLVESSGKVLCGRCIRKEADKLDKQNLPAPKDNLSIEMLELMKEIERDAEQKADAVEYVWLWKKKKGWRKEKLRVEKFDVERTLDKWHSWGFECGIDEKKESKK